MQTKIKTCDENCNILIANIKIHSRTISDRSNCEQNEQRRECCLICCHYNYHINNTAQLSINQ